MSRKQGHCQGHDERRFQSILRLNHVNTQETTGRISTRSPSKSLLASMLLPFVAALASMQTCFAFHEMNRLVLRRRTGPLCTNRDRALLLRTVRHPQHLFSKKTEDETKKVKAKDMKTFSARFYEDNGLEIVTDSSGSIKAQPKGLSHADDHKNVDDPTSIPKTPIQPLTSASFWKKSKNKVNKKVKSVLPSPNKEANKSSPDTYKTTVAESTSTIKDSLQASITKSLTKSKSPQVNFPSESPIANLPPIIDNTAKRALARQQRQAQQQSSAVTLEKPKVTSTRLRSRHARRLGAGIIQEHTPKVESVINSQKNAFNVVLTHCTADFDSLASAVGLAKLWSSPEASEYMEEASLNTSNILANKQGDDNSSQKPNEIPTYVVLPRGAHPAVARFLGLHKHLFPIRSLKSLPHDLSSLNRLGLVDAQRRDRVGPAEPLLGIAKRVTILDHHIDGESDIPEATDYVVEHVGSVSTMVVERLQQAGLEMTEAEATLLALGIHADTGSLCFDSTTPRDAYALAYCMEQGASQAAIAEHAQSSLSEEQNGVLTQALLNTNSTLVHGVTVTTVLLSADGFINGLAAVAQDVLELTSSGVLLFAVVYDPKERTNKRGSANNRRASAAIVQQQDDSPSSSRDKLNHIHKKMQNNLDLTNANNNNPVSNEHIMMFTEAWKGGEEALRRKRLQAAFAKKDADGSGYLERQELVAALLASGVIASAETVDQILKEIDTDGDGKVDFDEFEAFAGLVEERQKSLDAESGKRASTMIIIGRVKTGVNVKSVNLNQLFQQFGGGGHAKAASATVRLSDASEAGDILQKVVDELIETSLLEQPTVGEFMTAPVLSAKPSMNEKQVEDLFSRYDVRALPVVDDDNNVIGLVTYKEVAAAKQRLWNKEQKRLRREENEANGDGKPMPSKRDTGAEAEQAREDRTRNSGSALKGWMKQHVRYVEASTTLAEAEEILLENDVGCIPVVANGTKKLVGMVTRTDILRQHRYYPSLHYHNKGFSDSIALRKPIIELRKRLKKFDLENE